MCLFRIDIQLSAEVKFDGFCFRRNILHIFIGDKDFKYERILFLTVRIIYGCVRNISAMIYLSVKRYDACRIRVVRTKEFKIRIPMPKFARVSTIHDDFTE